MTNRTDSPASEERNPFEVLAEEFCERLRAGEGPTPEEYADRHPEWAVDIRQLFPAIAHLEGAKSHVPRAAPLVSAGQLQSIGDYRILREIGRGGMGIVYEAEQTSLRRRVAVKVVGRAGLLSEEQLRRFDREAHAAANLHHTNIVPVFGAGEDDGLHYYVMQYIGGHGLDKMSRQIRGQWADDTADLGSRKKDDVFEEAAPPSYNGVLQESSHWRGVARIGVQVADALRYAHSQGILHRDIKPANLLLDENGTVWVTDFGLAKLEEADGVTRSGDVVGTLQYLAPERLQGGGDARSDIYSLGLTLYELLTLRPPFDGATGAELIREVAHGRPVRPRKLNRAVPRDLETIVLKAINSHPDHRYQTAAQLRDDLEALLEDRPIRARRATSIERLWRWSRRNPAVAALSSISVCLLVLVAVVASVGYVQTDRALGSASRENQKAQANLRLALDAFEEIFSQANSAGLSLAVGDWTATEDEESEDPPFPPAVSEEFVTILQRLLSFYERFGEMNTDAPALELQMARAHHRVGDIQHRFGHYGEAETAYRRGLEIYDALGSTAGAPSRYSRHSQHWLERVQISNSLGLLLKMMARNDEAGESHRRAITVLGELTDDLRETPAARLERARTHIYLARLHREEPRERDRGRGRRDEGGGNEEVVEHYRLAIRTLRDLVTEEPSEPEHRATLALAYRGLRARWRDADGPVDPRAKAIGILDELRREYPSNPDYTYELAVTHAELSRGRGSPGDPRKARAHLETAVELGQQLVKRYPGVPRYTVLLVRHELSLAETLVDSRDRDKAAERVERSIRRMKALVRRSPSVPSYVYYLSKAEFFWGILKGLDGDLGEARSVLETATVRMGRSVQEDPYHRGAGLYLELSEELIALLRELGEDQEAEVQRRTAAVWKKSLRPRGRPTWFRGRSGSFWDRFRRPRGRR